MTTYSKREEIIAKIEALKEKAAALAREADTNNAMQLALKLVINGFYGATANKHFVCFCNGVAGTVTSHGRDLLQYMIDVNDEYWHKRWHLDTELHEYMGLTDVKPIPKNVVTTSYGDTDSAFVTYKPAMVSCGWEGDPLEFIHRISKFRVAPLFIEKLNEYAAKYGVQNIQDFEVEQISKSIIFLDKKMYVKNVVWEDGAPVETNPEWGKNGTYFEPESNIQSKGIDLVRSSTPVFAREKVKEIIKWFFKNPDTYSDRELVKLVRELKTQFKLAKIEDISHSSSCNNYDSKVIDDQTTFEVVKGTPHAVKAAALHNYLLNRNSQYKQKYGLIKSGQKVKYYATNNPIYNEFAYTAGAYPYEIATIHAPIDYDTQFEKCILSIINRFNVVLGLSPLTPKLTFTLSLF